MLKVNSLTRNARSGLLERANWAVSALQRRESSLTFWSMKNWSLQGHKDLLPTVFSFLFYLFFHFMYDVCMYFRILKIILGF